LGSLLSLSSSRCACCVCAREARSTQHIAMRCSINPPMDHGFTLGERACSIQVQPARHCDVFICQSNDRFDIKMIYRIHLQNSTANCIRVEKYPPATLMESFVSQMRRQHFPHPGIFCFQKEIEDSVNPTDAPLDGSTVLICTFAVFSALEFRT
jgi:hypothetical protein